MGYSDHGLGICSPDLERNASGVFSRPGGSQISESALKRNW
jgi:hypothetical protein